MRFERLGRRACRQRRQHRRFDFDVIVLVEEAANLAHGFRAQLKHFARRQVALFAPEFQTAGDQIGIALPLANLGIVDPVHLVRHRQQSFCQEL